MWSMRDLTATHSLHSLTVRLLVAAAVIDFFFFLNSRPLFAPLVSFIIYQIASLIVCVKASSSHSISRTADTFKRRNSQAVICFMYKKKTKKKKRAEPAAGFEIRTTAQRLRPPADGMDMAPFSRVSSSVASQHGQIPRTHSQTQGFLSIRLGRPASSAPGPPSRTAILNRHRIHWPSRCLMPC